MLCSNSRASASNGPAIPSRCRLEAKHIPWLAYSLATFQYNAPSVFDNICGAAQAVDTQNWKVTDMAVLLHSLAMAQHMPKSVVERLVNELRLRPKGDVTSFNAAQLYQADLTLMALRSGGTVVDEEPVILDKYVLGRRRAQPCTRK